MALTKHEFVDDYPYIVYTNEDTIVYSDKVDTSIDDIDSGGGGVEIGGLVRLSSPGSVLEVGDTVELYMLHGVQIKIGDSVIWGCGPDGTMAYFPEIASGAIVSTNGGAYVDDPDWDFNATFQAGTVTGSGTLTIATIRALDISTTPFEYESVGTAYYGFSFTVPELEDGEILFINCSIPD